MNKKQATVCIPLPQSNRRINRSTNSTPNSIDDRYLISFREYKQIKESTITGTFCVLKKVSKKGKIFITKTIKQDLNPLQRNLFLEDIKRLINDSYVFKSYLTCYHGFSYKDFRGADKITIFMDYYKQGSLYKLLEQQRRGEIKITNTQKQIILVGVCYAMIKLHSIQIIHCNLKPQNVLLDKNKPLVADAGFSSIRKKFLPDLKDRSYAYLAPEILKFGGDKFSDKSDVYSFGILMSEVITGDAPYDTNNPQNYFSRSEIIQKITKEEIKDGLKSLILKCLSLDPNDRPTFSDLYSKLSKDSSFLDEDDEYVLEDVDIDQLDNYIDFLNGVDQDYSSIQSSANNSTLCSTLYSTFESSIDSKCSYAVKPPSEKNLNSSFNRNMRKSEVDSNPPFNEQQDFNSLHKEIEELKLKLKKIEEEKNNLNKKCQNLEIENKKLKDENNSLKNSLKKNQEEETDNEDEEETSNSNETTNNENDQILIQSIEKVKKENTLIFNVPENTVRIPNSLFKDCDKLKEITIPQTVTVICSRSFYNCTSLTKINIPDSVSEIGDYSFYMCKMLTEITIPKTVHSIKDYTFYGCSNLTNISIPDSISSIGKSAFSECTKLSEISIPKFVTSIDDSVFSGCSSLKSVKIYTNCIKSIENNFFANCTSLTNVEIPSSVLSIQQGSFNHCKSLKKINIPSHVRKIERDAFAFCESLIEISIPSSVQMIGNGCFCNCINLKKIEIKSPSLMGCIVSNTFKNCKALSDLILPSTIISIGSSSFDGCSSLKKICFNEGLKYIKDDAFANCNELMYIRLPESTLEIEDSAFKNCDNLVKVECPSSLRMFVDDIFPKEKLKFY